MGSLTATFHLEQSFAASKSAFLWLVVIPLASLCYHNHKITREIHTCFAQENSPHRFSVFTSVRLHLFSPVSLLLWMQCIWHPCEIFIHFWLFARLEHQEFPFEITPQSDCYATVHTRYWISRKYCMWLLDQNVSNNGWSNLLEYWPIWRNKQISWNFSYEPPTVALCFWQHFICSKLHFICLKLPSNRAHIWQVHQHIGVD